MRFFSIDRIKAAIEHLQEYDSKWVLVPLVFAVNGVEEEEPVRVQGAGKAGTDAFFDKYFSGKKIGLPPFPNGANTLRPRFSEIKANLDGPGDYVVHQKQKLWGNQYSRNGYNIMRDRGLILDRKNSTWQIDPSFWAAWEKELPSSFRFEELLVWLFSFSGFADEVDDWEGLFQAFQQQTVGPGGFPDGYGARFKTSADVQWPADLLDERPSEEEFQEALMPSLKGPAHDRAWLEERFEEWSKGRQLPDDDEVHHLAMRAEFAGLLSEESLASPEDFDLDLFRKLLADNYGHPGHQSNLNRYLQEEGGAGVARLTEAISHLLYGDEDEAARLDAVADPESGLRVFGLGESVLTKCLSIVFPERWLPLFMYGSSEGKGKEDILGLLEAGIENAEALSMGERAVRSNDALRELTEPLAPGEPWAQAAFLWWLRTYGTDAANLASELHIDERWFRTVSELLEDKRQVIFYGPPGTGKTFVAQRFAEWYADDGCVETVQFHPSYTYEDFVQGFRPVGGKEGSVDFTLAPGPLLDLADKAKRTGKQCVLLIDEINRGNLAKIFGELYYLLEYRDEDIRLQYGDQFRLPENLVLIGTMNTADRSIAFIDSALRRRFHFMRFFPDAWPVSGLLRRWLEANKPEMSHVADLLDAANELLDDRDFQIGPAHFMTEKLDDDRLEMIWTYSVTPYLEEHFFDEPERAGDFDLERLLDKIRDDGTGDDAAPAEGAGTG
jgi:hypothetical protein